mmetsp:Transcript_21918/g.50410  ORF Transcript_21918/g.50410 Transcript_21918/m.50410 type:complete len:234 (+) Transcript_21918:188-889(+)
MPCEEAQTASPFTRRVVLEKLTMHGLSAIGNRDDGIDDPSGSIDLVERRLEAMPLRDLRGARHRVLIVDPTCVHGVHEDTSLGELLRACARHHIQRRLSHVGVRVIRRLKSVELALHRGNVNHLPRRNWGAQQQRSKFAVDNEGRECVDGEHLRSLARAHLAQLEQPAVGTPQVELLAVDVMCADRKELLVHRGLGFDLAPQWQLRPKGRRQQRRSRQRATRQRLSARGPPLD